MTWATFKAINARIIKFRGLTKKVTLTNFVAWSGGAIGLVVSFSGGFDWAVPRMAAYVTSKPELVGIWKPGEHWWLKLVASFAILGFFYVLAFSVQSAVLLSEQQAVTLPKPDFRAELARAIGVSFTQVRDYYDVINSNGDCHVILEADFEINDLPIGHIERKLSSASATARTERAKEAQVNPPKVSVFKDLKKTPKVWIYHFRFKPPLAEPAATCQTKITEDMTHGICMYLDEVEDDPVLGGRLESIGHLVQAPTNRLELKVRFPYDYFVDGDRFFKVRLGSTETPHLREESRILQENTRPLTAEDGRQILRLVVDRPTIGLCYFLCWEPPEKPAVKTTI